MKVYDIRYICAYERQSDTLKHANNRCRYIMLNIDDKCQPVKKVFLIKDTRTTFSSIQYREIFHLELCAGRHTRFDLRRGNFPLETACTLKKELLLLS